MSDIRVIATDLGFPEGPVAMADGSIVLTEIERQTITRILPDGRTEIIAHTGGGPNGLAVGPDGAFYAANNGGFSWRLEHGLFRPAGPSADYTSGSIQRVDPATGKVETLYDNCNGHKLRGPNDLVFDTNGGFYFSDLGKSRARDRDHGGLYYALADGSKIIEVAYPILTPNGVGLSPDETVVYAADTQLGRLWAFDISAPGELSPPPGFAPGRVICNLPGFQLLDSLAVEAGGKVCVATIINGGITAFDPDGSTEHFPVPDLVTTNICFGGPDMRDAWITASSTGRLYKCRWPRPGLKLNYNA